jgi:uncharacterized protein YukE
MRKDKKTQTVTHRGAGEFMNTLMIGADADELDRFGGSLENASTRLESVESQLTAVLRSVRWTGSDAQRFQAEWPNLGARLRATAAALATAGTAVHRNATEQRQASETGAVTGSAGALIGRSGGGGGGWGDPGWTANAGWNGLSGSAGAAGSGTVGDLNWTVDGSVETFTGHTGTNHNLSGPKYDPVTGTWTMAAAGVGAYAAYNFAAVTAHTGAQLGMFKADAQASGRIAAEGSVGANASFGSDGVKAHAGVGGFVGARGDISATGGFAGQEVTAGAHVTYGLEAELNADLEVSLDKIELSANWGVALGLGGGGDFKVELDPRAAVDNVNKLFDLWD